MLIDSHAHLDDKRFNGDREEIIANLEKDGIDLVINNGADLMSSIAAVKLAEEYENIYATVGFHPHSAKDLDQDSLEALRSLASREKVVAIGEIGLDYYRNLSPKDVQIAAFKKQLELAKELDLPVTIHSRDASQEVFNIIKEAQDGRLRGVMHCFSESVEMAEEYLKLGFYISLSGTVTFKNARVPKEVAKMLPLDRILVETDSPYLTPEPYRGKRNQPAYVRYVAAEIADIKEISFQELADATRRNTRDLFSIK